MQIQTSVPGGTNITELCFLTSTKYFQSAAVPGGHNSKSTPAQSFARYMPFYMKALFILIIFLSVIQTMEAQSNMEQDCLDKVHNSSQTKTFPRFENIITIFKDTVHYDKSIISLSDVSREFRGIFGIGIVFPKLILGASTNGDGEFKISKSTSQDTLSISSVRELKVATGSLNTKAFSFLLWEKGLANPKLYIVELSSNVINAGTEQFIRYSKLISFGFCSILI